MEVYYGQVSRPARGAWIEIVIGFLSRILERSRPARGAWIEINTLLGSINDSVVAPRTGRVD